MSRLYGNRHRALQDRFETRNLADAVEAVGLKTEIDEEARAFIESRDMFFLSTVDHDGRPTVSYKGGDPGFVKVVDSRTIAFPSYNGNGMFYSMGNISGNGHVGLLFIDFENPHRLRFQGTASIQDDDPLLGIYAEAELVVRVTLAELFINCPRYIHRYKKLGESRYVPRAGIDTPIAEWKRIDQIQPALPATERAKVERAGGLITMEEYYEKMKSGEA